MVKVKTGEFTVMPVVTLFVADFAAYMVFDNISDHTKDITKYM